LSEDKKKKSKFYDVDAFYKVYRENQRRRGRAGRIVGRFTRSLDSIHALLVSLLMFLIPLGTLLAVVYGATLGPVGFIAIFGCIFGGLTLFVERKVGRSLQFGDYNLFRRVLGTVAAFGILLGLLFLFLLLKLVRL
jgi:hypothetical protein